MPSSQAPTSTKEAAGFTLHTERLGPLPPDQPLHRAHRPARHPVAPHPPRTLAAASPMPARWACCCDRSSWSANRSTASTRPCTASPMACSASVPQEMEHLSDDRLRRALDRLFDADRTALLTELVLAVGQRFGVRFEEFHNDSTSIASAAATAAPEAARFALAPRPRSPSGIRRRTGRTSSNCCSF